MELWQFKISAEKDHAYAIFEALEPVCITTSIFEEQENPALYYVEGMCMDEPAESLIEQIVSETAQQLTPAFKASWQIMPVEEKDWIAENCKSLPPLEVANFFIYGSHINPAEYVLQSEYETRIPLKIEASTAFGTGHHGTTRGCLRALWQLYQAGWRPKKPFDLGCGTGILALAIAKLFNVPVLASDIDPEASLKTLENARENAADELIQVITADGLEHPEIQARAPFDLLVANILSGPLIDLAKPLLAVLAPGGYLVLSGILQEQGSAVKAAYQQQLMTLTHESLDEGWLTLVFHKQATA
jgi:ribosomal protein L11 methyltransferase